MFLKGMFTSSIKNAMTMYISRNFKGSLITKHFAVQWRKTKLTLFALMAMIFLSLETKSETIIQYNRYNHIIWVPLSLNNKTIKIFL